MAESSRAEARFLVQETIVDLVGSIVADGPAVVALEDLHWADVSSLATILAVARRFRNEPLVLVLTARSVEFTAELDRLAVQLDELDALALELAPLDTAAVQAVAADLAGAPPGPNLRAQLGQTGGNPFYVGELLRSLQSDGGLTVFQGTAEVQDPDRREASARPCCDGSPRSTSRSPSCCATLRCSA